MNALSAVSMMLFLLLKANGVVDELANSGSNGQFETQPDPLSRVVRGDDLVVEGRKACAPHRPLFRAWRRTDTKVTSLTGAYCPPSVTP